MSKNVFTSASGVRDSDIILKRYSFSVLLPALKSVTCKIRKYIFLTREFLRRMLSWSKMILSKVLYITYW